jgi:ABC-type uncharacterized transport system substrate-binding protein
MRRLSLLVGFAIAASLWLAGAAGAHPHVWVTVKSELIFASDGKITGVRHAWTFDDMFSAFATQGLEQKTKGQFTREELASLAEVNVTSLKEFGFFTFAKINGQKVPFKDATDYWLDYRDGVLTLHFTLALVTPAKPKVLDIDIYDPTYFVDFTFADKAPVVLAGAPAACKFTAGKPQDLSKTQSQRLGEAFFNNLDTASNWGAQFANRLVVTCP